MCRKRWWVVAGAADSGSVRPTRRAVAILVVLALAGLPHCGPAYGGRFATAEEAAAGVGGIVSDLWPLSGAGRPTTVVALTDVRLYGVAGLHAPGIRAGVRVGACSLHGEWVQVTSGVGTETTYRLEPAAYGGDRWIVSVALVCRRVVIDGFLPDVENSFCVGSRVRLTGSIALGGWAGGFVPGGESDGGADITTAVIVAPAGPLAVRAAVEIDRLTGVYPRMSATLSAGSVFRFTAGYTGVTGAVAGALAVRFSALECAALAEVHPVLGRRSGVTLSWRR